jgi:predicted DNA-binding protein YlxM (UPF0122 family)
MLDQTTEINLLYDFYGSLLTEKQQFLMECYYFDDWSLSEIANHQGTSRQAVFEGMKRAEQHLIEYENKLELVAKHRQREQIAKKILSKISADSFVEEELTSLIRQMID